MFAGFLFGVSFLLSFRDFFCLVHYGSFNTHLLKEATTTTHIFTSRDTKKSIGKAVPTLQEPQWGAADGTLVPSRVQGSPGEAQDSTDRDHSPLASVHEYHQSEFSSLAPHRPRNLSSFLVVSGDTH